MSAFTLESLKYMGVFFMKFYQVLMRKHQSKKQVNVELKGLQTSYIFYLRSSVAYTSTLTNW